MRMEGSRKENFILCEKGGKKKKEKISLSLFLQLR